MGNADEIDTVFCFHAETGEVIWKHTYACTKGKDYFGTRVTPTVHKGAVYTLSRAGHVFRLKAKSGKVVWSKDLKKELGVEVPGWGFAGSPLILGKLVILNMGRRGVALNKKTGEVVWSSEPAKAGYASAVPFSTDHVQGVAVFSAKALFGVNAADGNMLWSYPWKTSWDVNAVTPIFEGDKVFISSNYGKGGVLLKIGQGEPEVIWRNKNMRNHFQTCVLWRKHLTAMTRVI